MKAARLKLLLGIWMCVLSLATGHYLYKLQAPAQSQQQSQVVKRAVYATVVVSTEEGLGAGAIIDGRGFILTCAHVVDTSKSGRVRVLFFNQAKSVIGLVVWRDEERDLALVKVHNKDVPQSAEVLPIATDRPIVGDQVYTVGHPRGDSWVVGQGIISKYLSRQGNLVLVQTTALMHPGNSGGPLVNSEGELVGISSRVLSENPFSYVPMSMNFAVSQESIREFLAEVQELTTFSPGRY